MWEAITVLSNVACCVVLVQQHRRHKAYREKIHALLTDDGHVEDEPAIIIDEALRVTANMKLPEPSARDFAHALSKQENFRKAVAHELLHDVYVRTQGRSA